MGEDFAGQKKLQDTFLYSMTGSLVVALVSGWFFQCVKTGWHAYLVGLSVTWLINIVDWEYWFPASRSWAEGRLMDAEGYWELERMADVSNLASPSSSSSSPPKLQHRAQITLSGGPARMTISSRPPLPLPRFKKW